MPFPGKPKVREIELFNGVKVLTGPRGTRATIQAEFPTVPIGSLYISTTGELFIKSANTGANTDWTKGTFSASD